MTAAADQNFSTFQGDAILPVFIVKDPDGLVVNISTITEITWRAKRFPDNVVVLEKTKTAGQIIFTTNGEDGKFQVDITASDTASLAGIYLHEATVTDPTAGRTTIASGQMTVGLVPVATASVYDLCSLDAVKQWLGIPSATINSDAKLQSLISACSRFLLSYLSRGNILPRVVTERREGYGQPRMLLKEWPVQSITSLMVGTVTVPAGVLPSPSNQTSTSGWLLQAADVNPPGTMQTVDLFGGYTFSSGRQNVQITYVAGYMVSAEAATIPAAAPYVVTPLQPYGSWGSSYAVTIDGVAATKVAAAPAAGQYSVNTVGNYTFNAADHGKTLALTYGYVPTDLAQACIQTVAEYYSYSDRVGILSKSLGGQETISFSVKDLSDSIKLQLQNYRNVIPI